MVVVVTCYCYMHPTRMRIASSCCALRVRGARDEVRLVCVRHEMVRVTTSRSTLLGTWSSSHNRNDRLDFFWSGDLAICDLAIS